MLLLAEQGITTTPPRISEKYNLGDRKGYEHAMKTAKDDLSTATNENNDYEDSPEAEANFQRWSNNRGNMF